DDAGLDGEQVDAHQGDPDPGIDHDALVQDAVQNVDETGAPGGSFNRHVPLPPRVSAYRIERTRRAVPRPGAPAPTRAPRLFLLEPVPALATRRSRASAGGRAQRG